MGRGTVKMRNFFIAIAVLGLGLCDTAPALELFAKGSYSKNSISQDNFITSVSGTGGFAFSLIPRVRLEARYTNSSSLQNSLQVGTDTIVVTLTDVLTQTSIYSAGLDIDILGPRSPFQPFLYIGVGYLETLRSYYFTIPGGPSSGLISEPKQLGVSANGGAGFRVRLADRISFEVEAFVYALNIQKPNPTINVQGTVGLRLFL